MDMDITDLHLRLRSISKVPFRRTSTQAPQIRNTTTYQEKPALRSTVEAPDPPALVIWNMLG